ncbi:hypothetical protein TNCV_254541 [Trichonephila clavipes]|nr:hypothetical protein TNCV_254541 [Trichonephila clavipes]
MELASSYVAGRGNRCLAAVQHDTSHKGKAPFANVLTSTLGGFKYAEKAYMYDRAACRKTVLASSFYSQYGLPTISGLPLHDGKGRYRPEKSIPQKVSRSW